jgi:hypothetical protein
MILQAAGAVSSLGMEPVILYTRSRVSHSPLPIPHPCFAPSSTPSNPPQPLLTPFPLPCPWEDRILSILSWLAVGPPLTYDSMADTPHSVRGKGEGGNSKIFGM